MYRQHAGLSRQHQSRLGRQLLAGIVGMRSPALDLALRMPDSAAEWRAAVAPDAWMYPNLNTGCVIKFNEKGEVLESLWDLGGKNHPMITSIREHKGTSISAASTTIALAPIKFRAPIPIGAASIPIGRARRDRRPTRARQFPWARRGRRDGAGDGWTAEAEPASGSRSPRAEDAEIDNLLTTPEGILYSSGEALNGLPRRRIARFPAPIRSGSGRPGRDRCRLRGRRLRPREAARTTGDALTRSAVRP